MYVVVLSCFHCNLRQKTQAEETNVFSSNLLPPLLVHIVLKMPQDLAQKTDMREMSQVLSKFILEIDRKTFRYNVLDDLE